MTEVRGLTRPEWSVRLYFVSAVSFIISMLHGKPFDHISTAMMRDREWTSHIRSQTHTQTATGTDTNKRCTRYTRWPKWVFWRTKIEISSAARPLQCFVEFLMCCLLIHNDDLRYDDQIVVWFLWFSCCCRPPPPLLRLPILTHVAGKFPCAFERDLVDGRRWPMSVCISGQIYLYLRTYVKRKWFVIYTKPHISLHQQSLYRLLYHEWHFTSNIHVERTNWRNESLGIWFSSRESLIIFLEPSKNPWANTHRQMIQWRDVYEYALCSASAICFFFSFLRDTIHAYVRFRLVNNL